MIRHLLHTVNYKNLIRTGALKVEYTNHSHFVVSKGTTDDIDQLEQLYLDLTDYLEKGINYPGWSQKRYPVRQTAIDGVANSHLYVLKISNNIAGSIILSHEPEAAYSQVKWEIEANDRDIIVLRTLAVHPAYMKSGVAKALLDYAREYAVQHKMKAIRLDAFIDNVPAIALYEKCQYQYRGTVDLGLNIPGLQWFKLYEMIL